jgi:leader peptidase (prepilin peptidase)/N-methyltransferase
MWWDSPKPVVLMIYSLAGAIIGYGLKRFSIPRILYIYDLQAHAWHWRYPLFEGMSILCSALTTLRYAPFAWSSLAVLVLIWGLLVLVFIDAEHFILPDPIIRALWTLGFFVNGYEQLYTAIEGSVVAYSTLRLFSDAYYRLTGRVGLGRGDVKLFGIFGAWFGCTALPFILSIASLSGLLWATIALYLKKRTYHMPIPFGPFLAWGAWCYLMMVKTALDSAVVIS